MNPFNILKGFINLSLKSAGLKGDADDHAAQRIEECVKCEHGGNGEIESWNKFCKVCGCFCPAKVLAQSESCPKGKW